MHVLLSPLHGLLGSFDLSSDGGHERQRGESCSMIGHRVSRIACIDRLHQRNAETAIKRDMLERGLSVEEMERVLAVKAKNLK